MTDDFKHDLFLSFSHHDLEKARPIYQRLTDSGLRVFWSEERLELGRDFPPQLEKALLGSEHFAVYFSEHAKESKWVRIECDLFRQNCHMQDEKNRRMFVIMDPSCHDTDVPLLLQSLHRPKTWEAFVAELVKIKLEHLQYERDQAMSSKKQETEALGEELKNVRRQVEEARKFYGRNRFWAPIAEHRDVHIFTCARNIQHDPTTMRGQGGRTNIDLWDYRAVLDITHFFASNYPGAKVKIEDPVSKLSGRDLTEAPRLGERISEMRSRLQDKDCIIIGSPDVSDFAEIVLAKINGIDPYTGTREKKSGFVVIKDRKSTSSSFYWKKGENDEEGVAQIYGPNKYKIFPQGLPSLDGRVGKMYGILVVANNPFGNRDKPRKIIILSGFSGVATNAISKILTDDLCCSEFFKFDEAFANLDRNVEALIGVEYAIDPDADIRDTRRIKNITFEALVEI